MAKFLFFAHDPGGANAIVPLIEPLKKIGNELFIYAKGNALLKLPDSIELQENDLKVFLKNINPDCIITGTSANDFTEKYLWKAAKDLNIASIAILDYWSNYGIRFSKYGTKDIEKYNHNKTFDYLPDFIIVMDEFAKSEMVQEGIDEKIIYPLGNPHFENIIEQSKTVKNVYSKFATKNEFLITFASQPYNEDYGKGNEKLVLEHLIEAVQNKNVKIVIKLHPKEDFSKYAEFKDLPNVILDKDTLPTEIIMASDLLISMTSMFLIEAMILGKNILSYQPDEISPDKFVLTRNKMLPFVKTKKNFKEKVLNILNGERYLRYNHDREFNAVEKILNFIREELCR